jgi:glycosyltransferase XagB
MVRLQNKYRQLYQRRLNKSGEAGEHVVVVIPTYNEKDNIGPLIEGIQAQIQYLQNAQLSILVVDDSSPDGTAQVVQTYAKRYENVYLLKGQKQGLGRAYIRGFKYAMRYLQADIVFEMDADFSHDPAMISFFVYEIQKGKDFVIGSRYIEGGSIPSDWPYLRKLNSQWGNIFARHVAGLGSVKDCTSGYRAIRTSLLKKINLNKLKAKGYAFQIDLLHKAIKNNARISEVPIQFTDRIFGNSKLRKQDIAEFVINSFLIRMPYLLHVALFIMSVIVAITAFIFGNLVGLALMSVQGIGLSLASMENLIIAGLVTLSVLMVWQSIFSLYLMMYGWEDVDRIELDKLPAQYAAPKYSFTALVPVRHEERVIGDTIRAIAAINYPEHLKETLIIVRIDDHKTREKAEKVIKKLNKPNVKLVLFGDLPINKPHSLNIGLSHATKDIVVIFDAEDQPSRDIYNVANTQMFTKKLDVLQSGVQLMNFKSNWFSTLNVLEYFFWFKSALHFFAKQGIIPLGGNTVFFKRKLLNTTGGWDEDCLTEDADIGIRMSSKGAKIGVVYDERHTTQEETPHSLESFIKQRTRWNQGFMQILWKGEWTDLPQLRQRLLAAYILIIPQLQAFFFLMLPISIFMAFVLDMPVLFAMITIVPLLLLLLQLIASTIGLYEFTKGYGMKFPIMMPAKLLFTFFPYQVILGLSAMRAIFRLVSGKTSWEKTLHLNAHRPEPSIAKVKARYFTLNK